MEKKKILFVINQFFKGGAEVALLNLFHVLSSEKYEIDFLIFDQIQLNHAISLIDEIPDYVNVFHASEQEGKVAFAKKAVIKFIRKTTDKQLFRQNVYQFLKEKRYDVAISYGEWFSSSLVALYTTAKYKYVWIHADMEKASFLHPDIVQYQQYFDQFIFVSEKSRMGAETKYSFLKNRSIVVNNIVDSKGIKEQSQKSIGFPKTDLPVLVTVANIRAEKNHLRQVKVMQQLFQRGLKFHWINIGSFSDLELVNRIKNTVHEAGLNQYFHLFGAKDNPYAFMKQADAVCVLSDHESWSMVITEAKTLGVPVIATKTSGALEQIVDGETGILCDFSVDAIVNQINRYLKDCNLQQKIRENLQSFNAEAKTLRQLNLILQQENKKIVYIFDDINYVSGARNATFAHIECLEKIFDVTLFSAEPCKDAFLKEKYKILDLEMNRAFRCLSVPFKTVVMGKNFRLRDKIVRLLYAVSARVHMDDKLYDWLLQKDVKPLLENFDFVCVVSEASKLRMVVAKLQKPKKIQWIHTDYVAWRQQSSWTRAITHKDEKLYAHYDVIVLLSKRLKEKFDAYYPSLRGKTLVRENPIQREQILKKSLEKLEIGVDKDKFNLITIGRMEQEKRYDNLLLIAKELSLKGIKFHWYFVGDGCLRSEIEEQCKQLCLEEHVTITGNLNNPYPLLKQCDLFVLFSEYEGTPVTIDEAKVLGVPVLANDVGGIRDQLEDGKYGQVFNSNNLQNISEVILNKSRV